jgi:uncharacterized damage-inducible protein DinB
MKALLLNYLQFNSWANDKFITWLNSLPPEALYEKSPSSFPSIIETMLHIWDAQTVWVERLEGNSMNVFPSKSFEGTWDDVCALVQETSHRLIDVATPQDTVWFSQECNYQLMNGTLMQTPICDMILHCVQHSTFHRGQIVTISHCLHQKEPVPATDYIKYVRETHSKTITQL